MTAMLLDAYCRLLARLPAGDPWPALEDSGFLDLLRPEPAGGAELSLEELFPLALETGRHADAPAVLEAMAERLTGADTPRTLAAVLTAGQMAGALAQVQTLTLDYARTRRQFGREIGRFQAVQQQLAVLAEEVVAARMAAEAAFVGSPIEPDELRAGTAKVRCGQAAAAVCRIAHAVLGAVGVSQEHELHRFTRRLRAWRMAHGGETWWSRRLGQWALTEPHDVTTLARLLA